MRSVSDVKTCRLVQLGSCGWPRSWARSRVVFVSRSWSPCSWPPPGRRRSDHRGTGRASRSTTRLQRNPRCSRHQPLYSKHIICIYHITSYHITDHKRQNRLKVGTDKPKSQVKSHVLSWRRKVYSDWEDMLHPPAGRSRSLGQQPGKHGYWRLMSFMCWCAVKKLLTQSVDVLTGGTRRRTEVKLNNSRAFKGEP